MGNCTSSGGSRTGAGGANVGDILVKDNGKNTIKFEVKRKSSAGVLIEVKESTFDNLSRFAKGKTVVVDEDFLNKNIKKRQAARMTSEKYDKLPLSTQMFGGRYASKEDKAIKRATIKSFLDNAKVGNVYSTGSGFGSGGGKFEIVSYGRSPNKMGIRSGGRVVALTSANVAKYIANGAQRVKKSAGNKRV